LNPRPGDYESLRAVIENQSDYKKDGHKYIFTEKEIYEFIKNAKSHTAEETVRGIKNKVAQFLRDFGHNVKVKVGKRKTIESIYAEIDYDSIIQFNQYVNTLTSSTPLRYVKDFLNYWANKWTDPILKGWADSLSYRSPKIKRTFAEEGEKAAISWKDIEEDLKIYYDAILNVNSKNTAKKYFRNLVTILYGITTGKRPREIDRTKSAWIEKGMEVGYYIIPAKATKTKAERPIPIHPKIKPFLELLIELYPEKPFSETSYRKIKTEINAKVRMNQLRNFATKYWTDYGIDDLRRIAIMGHDEAELKKAIEESRRLKEVLESLGIEVKAGRKKALNVSEIYRKYTPDELIGHYMETVGRNFNPIPEWLDFEKIAKILTCCCC